MRSSYLLTSGRPRHGLPEEKKYVWQGKRDGAQDARAGSAASAPETPLMQISVKIYAIHAHRVHGWERRGRGYLSLEDASTGCHAGFPGPHAGTEGAKERRQRRRALGSGKVRSGQGSSRYVITSADDVWTLKMGFCAVRAIESPRREGCA